MIEQHLLTDLGVRAAVAAIGRGETTSADLVEACLRRIASTDDELKAWVTVDADGARAAARLRDDDVRAGRRLGPLHGVPLGIKDIVDVTGMPTTAGAGPFAHRHPRDDAPLVGRLRAAGAVIVGKTVPTPFAYRDPAPTRNPWSAARTPGGSSSGSAAAVAARQVPAAIGTQTVGSILRPAAFCGVVGLKGAHGSVPIDGVVTVAPSFDHVGPLARSVADAALIESLLAGDALEIHAIDSPTLGLSPELLDGVEPGLRAHLDEVVKRLADAGAEIEEVRLAPSLRPFIDAGWLVLEVEAAAYHEPMFAEHRDEYPPEIGGLVESGLARSTSEVLAAQRTLAEFRAAFGPILDGLDALLSPVAPGPAPVRGSGTGDPGFCAPASFAGVPAISIPTGIDSEGLPLALQLIAGPGRIQRLLDVAALCEALVAFGARPHLPVDGA